MARQIMKLRSLEDLEAMKELFRVETLKYRHTVFVCGGAGCESSHCAEVVNALKNAIALRGLGQHGRIAAGDLHRARLVLAIVDQAQARLAAVPQADVAGHHLRYHHPGAKATAKLTERTIGHPGHRREDQSVGQCIWADAYHRHGASLSCGAAKKGRA